MNLSPCCSALIDRKHLSEFGIEAPIDEELMFCSKCLKEITKDE